MPIKTLHIGLGPIGAGVVRQVAARKGFKIVGAVDIDPAKIGMDLGDVCAVGRKLRVKIAGDIAKTIRATRPDVAVLCTSSSLKRVVPEFEAVLKLKVPIVSTTGSWRTRCAAMPHRRRRLTRWPSGRAWPCSARA